MRGAGLLYLVLGCSAASPSTTVASGFEARRDGFSFANFRTPPDAPLLGGEELAELFGPEACQGGDATTCVPTPAATAWARAADGALSYGHCEGMALYAAVLFAQREDAFMLLRSTDGIGPVERAIARWSATQLTAVDETVLAPGELVARLQMALAHGELPALLGLYLPDRADGHTVLPVALLLSEERTEISVYDPNAPGALRALVMENQRWHYDGAPLPDSVTRHYQGDGTTDTLTWLPIASRLGLQPLPF